MIPAYRVLAERIRAESASLARVVDRVEGALARAGEHPGDSSYYLSAAALDLHGFYAGVERIFELVANGVDESVPKGAAWHRDLLAQMALEVPGLRAAVLKPETRIALTDYLEFRHVVRNLYSFDLRLDRVAELSQHLRSANDLLQRDLRGFVAFLEGLSTADETDVSSP